MPSVGDSCATCFHLFQIPNSAGPALAGKYSCNKNSPNASLQNAFWLWPVVGLEFWCGDGCSQDTGCSFSLAAQQIVPGSSSTSQGTFTMTAQDSVTVTDANCKATSTIKVWQISGTPLNPKVAIVTTPGAGSFGAATSDSSDATGTFGYTIYN